MTDFQPVQADQDGTAGPLALALMADTLRGVEAHLRGVQARLQALEKSQADQRWQLDAAWLVGLGFIGGLIVGLAVW